MKNRSYILIIALLPAFCLAQKKPAAPAQAAGDSIFFAPLKYRLIGPFRGGRADAVSGSLTNKHSFYFGATGGGLWKTTDGGSNWKNVSDGFFGGGVGAVAVAPSDESIVYAGQGESTLRNNVSEDLGGIWRSDNGGRSWRSLGLKDSRHIARIVVHPKDPDIAWVAVMGHLFGPNTERGVYKTTDGGESWTNLSAHKGLPKGVWGVVNIAVAASNPDKLYAMIENAQGGLFLSTDRGDTWTKVNSENEIRQRAWYYNRVYVDPTNENTVYVLNVEFMRSLDGGKSFTRVQSPHSDHHDQWIDPSDGHRLILADDGGAQVSYNAGGDWSAVDNQPTAQIYRVSTDNAFPYHILGAQQDNSSVRIKSRTAGPGITERDWEPTAGFESGYIVADPLNPDIVYGGNYDGYLGRLNHHTGENRAIDVWPDNPTGSGADSLRYRFQWNYPIFFSPHNPHRLYAAGNELFVTENDGQSWTTLSPDLTTNDKSMQGPSGGPITKDNTSAEYYCTIFTATESPLEKDLLWTGSDDGLVHVSRDGGGHWDKVTPPGAGKWTLWNCIETDPFKKGRAWVVGTRLRLDDYTPYIFRTDDYGKTWKLVTKGIPAMHFTRVVRADHRRPNLLYAGTEYGMYISYDGGDNWAPFQQNLPIVPVTDLTIKDNDLVIATQGRGFWSLDDLSLLQQYNPDLTRRHLHVFETNDAWRMEGGGGRRNRDAFLRNAGKNPPNGVVFNYWLNEAPDSPNVSITIFDKKHQPIRTFSTHAKDADTRLECSNGMNSFVWDMFYAPAEKIPGMLLWTGGAGTPKAAPGKYTARFRYDKDSADIDFTIKADPSYAMTEADYDAQVGFLLEVRDKYNEVQKAILRIRSLRTQLQDLNGRLDSSARPIRKFSDSVIRELTSIEEALYQTKSKSAQDMLNYPIRINDKLSGVYGIASGGNAVPSKQAREVFAGLRDQADKQLGRLKQIVDNNLPTLNKMIYEREIPAINTKDQEPRE